MGTRAVRVPNSDTVGSSNGNGLGPMRRFGIFEVDLRAGELRRSGYRVKLQEQPFQVLAQLLERPGEVVHARGSRATISCSPTPSLTLTIA